MKNNKIKAGMILITFSIIFLSVPSAVSEYTDSSLSDVIDAGEIHVGIEAAYPPFEQKTGDVIEGFDPSIMEFIADDMGVDIVYHDVAWDTIFTSLATGAYDCVISAVTITNDRMTTMNFTRWYFLSSQAVMVKNDSTLDIDSVDDVNNASIKCGIQASTTSQWYLEDEDFACSVVPYTTITLALAALDAGTVDVVLGDLVTLIEAGDAITGSEFEIVAQFSPEAFGIACDQGANTLVVRMNEAIDKLLGDDPYNPVFSTEYIAIYEEWIGTTPSVNKPELKEVLDSLVQPVIKNTINGFSIFSLIAIIPVTVYGVIRKSKKKNN
ncbi:hypothetical protein NEF87_002476 [Candidatus Lokiarchaeum ossiferum]|uniref:Solute-binding protein family 3/N-terminal domain-containing protein n=1 Tax=Candidatus Lokiarchaeum ossiferum TaxID=2951803 RepID=A0ABY6HRZ3_9ARCH|nr:hypothetical protein NEF87_002476 [Candidatus Lokiarchaeum sp. B-35]